MLLITFHGGDPGINNVAAYAGTIQNPAVLSGNADLCELRGLGFGADGRLWVLSGGKKASAIYAFTGSDISYADPVTIAAYAPGSALLHPFDFAFDDAGHVYVSNQDTNVVARLQLDGTPAKDAKALPKGTYLPGTFVASAVKIDPKITKVPTPAGLEASIVKGKVQNSVRGLAWANGLLYVADEVAGVVKTYDRDGAFQGQSNTIGSPVHLLVVGQSLYVSNGKAVYGGGLTEAPQLQATTIDAKSPAGMALDGDGTLYVASRTDKRIYSFSGFPDDPQPVTHFSVGDEPEFVLYT